MQLVKGTPDQTGTHVVGDALQILWELHHSTQHAVVIKVEVKRDGSWGTERIWAFCQNPEWPYETAVFFAIRAGRQLYRNSDVHDDIIEWLRQQGVDVS